VYQNPVDIYYNMRKCFKLGTIKEHWKPIQESQWYDRVFEDFINKEIIGYFEKRN
jgi:hypothetical protein